MIPDDPTPFSAGCRVLGRRTPAPLAAVVAVMALSACGSNGSANSAASTATVATGAASTSGSSSVPAAPSSGQAATSSAVVTVTATSTITASSAPASPTRTATATGAGKVPAGAHTSIVSRGDFASPTRKLVCSMGDQYLRCDVGLSSGSATVSGVSCPDTAPQADMERGGAPHFACAPGDGDPAYVGGPKPEWFTPAWGDSQFAGTTMYALAYGHVVRNSWAACVIDRTTGVTCASLDGRHGFTLSADAAHTW